MKLLTMIDVMQLLGVKSRTTIYRMIERGELPKPAVTLGGRLRWDEREVKDAIAIILARDLV